MPRFFFGTPGLEGIFGALGAGDGLVEDVAELGEGDGRGAEERERDEEAEVSG